MSYQKFQLRNGLTPSAGDPPTVGTTESTSYAISGTTMTTVDHWNTTRTWQKQKGGNASLVGTWMLRNGLCTVSVTATQIVYSYPSNDTTYTYNYTAANEYSGSATFVSMIKGGVSYPNETSYTGFTYAISGNMLEVGYTTTTNSSSDSFEYLTKQ